ncbi:DNA gyrase inhibitor [Priestia megaterium]|uniref:AraC family transcriptional regulator n=1 Tax=Priestia megaterium TaxID=1404 RepID=UPI000BFAAED0|nr:GyrI-like domain-containing protein [Priestia megaterium]PEU67309.1 DNA gyrase inhibitor [Priestia megaterium]
MNIKIDRLPSYRIAYLRQVGPYGPHNVKVMEKLKSWAKKKGLFNKNSTILSIPRDNPEVTSPENCRYDACIVISNEYQIDNNVSEDRLIGGQYRIYRVKHTAEEIQKAWDLIFVELLNEGYLVDSRPMFERYYGEEDDVDYCDICIPIILKQQ